MSRRRPTLAALPRSLAARIVRMALWNVVAVDELVAPWSRETVGAVLDLAAGRPGRRRDLPGRRTARRDRVYVHVTSPYEIGDARLMGELP